MATGRKSRLFRIDGFHRIIIREDVRVGGVSRVGLTIHRMIRFLRLRLVLRLGGGIGVSERAVTVR